MTVTASRRNIIGIVGGVGPYAGLDLMKKVSRHHGFRVIFLDVVRSIADKYCFKIGIIILHPLCTFRGNNGTRAGIEQ